MSAQPYGAPPPWATPPQDAPRPRTSADILAALGEPITLLDGSTVRLRYSMGSLRLLEQRFGSLKGIQIEIAAAQRAMNVDAELEASPDASSTQPIASTAASAPLFSILTDALLPGLIHERRDGELDDGTPIRYRLGRRPDLADELLDPAQLQQYMEAFAAALQAAFGDLAGEAGRAAMEAAQLSSRGESGTTSRQSSAADQIGSSGA